MPHISNYYKNFANIEIYNFVPKSKKYCVIVGVLNNGDDFKNQLQRMQNHRDKADIIIVDGGSVDDAVTKDSIKDKANTLIICHDTTGLSHQYQSALDYALEQGYEGMIMMDGNGKDGVSAVGDFVAALEDGNDFVQGSRFLSGGGHTNTPWIRYLAMKLLFTPLMNIASGYKYTDAINGFKAVSRSFLLHDDVQPFRNVFPSYSLQFYLNYHAPKAAKKLCEIPVERNYPSRKAFPSKIRGVRGYLNILKLLLNTCFGKYNPS